MAATERNKGKGGITPLRLGLVLLTLALGAALVHQSSSAPADVGLPAGLAGKWTTGDPRYEHRSLELSTEAIMFSTSEDESITYPIARVEQGSGDDSKLYTIRFEVGEELQQLSLLFQENAGVVRLPNQPHVEWRQRGTPN